MLRQHLLFGVLIHKPAVPTGYLEAQSLKRTRGFSNPHRRQEGQRGLVALFNLLFFGPFLPVSVTGVHPLVNKVTQCHRHQRSK